MHLKASASIRLLSIGDGISPGIYSLHSRFRRVINYVNDHDTLISITDETISPGPFHIIIHPFESDALIENDVLEITLEECIIGQIRMLIDAEKLYDSRLQTGPIDLKLLESNLSGFKEALIIQAPDNSLAFLLNARREALTRWNFEKNVLMQICSGVDLLFEGKTSAAIQKMNGVGFGLTPSGDDFLIGFLWGLYLIERIYGEDYQKLRDDIYHRSSQTNRIARQLLYAAWKGMFQESVKLFFFSLLHGDIHKDKTVLQGFLSVGHTSGSDMGTGFLMAFAYFNRLQESIW